MVPGEQVMVGEVNQITITTAINAAGRSPVPQSETGSPLLRATLRSVPIRLRFGFASLGYRDYRFHFVSTDTLRRP